MEIAWKEHQDNISNYYAEVFICLQCAPGCDSCTGPEPCLADYNWPFRWVVVETSNTFLTFFFCNELFSLYFHCRISLLTISVGCALGCCILAGYLFHHRRVKVFKVASPIFLLITLIGCAIMYLEVSTEIWHYLKNN